MDYIILTNPEKCVKCISCIRTCEVHANIVKEDFVDIVPEMCVVCGACIRACPENARSYLRQTDIFNEWLKSEKIIAVVAPSYVAHYDEPYKFITALKELGVSAVYEVAFGAELSSLVIAEEIRSGKKVIASPCPTVVNYIKKWFPELVDRLSKAVSPMIAIARYIKKKEPNVKIVFIGPCISKKSEITQVEVKGDTDLALTFEEFDELLKDKKMDLEHLTETHPDGFDTLYGLSYPVVGGLAKTVSYYLQEDLDIVLEKDTVIIDGKENVMKFLEKYSENIKNGRDDMNPVLSEALYCDGGCIGGPGIRKDLEVFEKRRRIIEYTLDNLGTKIRDLAQRIYREIDLTREYIPEKVEYKTPSEAEINSVLKKIGMLKEPLNCGACGYPTCRDRAIAVLNGLMPWDLCIQYQLRKMEEEHKREINKIKEEAIESAQKVITEQMKIAQEIASLLGETVAETKASLLKILNLVMDETRDEK
ncbi:MAG: 4Fe-4S binding protein [Thermotogae bacterium]|nr:4Fe-4S binding protein [Thermotogota bacterium]